MQYSLPLPPDGDIVTYLHEVTGQFEIIDGGIRLKTTEDQKYYIDVIEMIYSWRLVRTPVVEPMTYDRGFCYFGFKEGMTKHAAFMTACLAGVLWDGADDTEPACYDKKVHT